MGHNQQAGQRRSRRPAFKQTTLSFVIAAVIYSAPLHAQHVELNLPSQPLQQSIQQLARQSGAEIISAGSILSNKTAPRIKGKVSVEQALNAMLQGTSLTVQKQGSVYAIVEKKAAASPAVQLQQKQPAQLEGFVSSPADQPAVQMNAITVYGAKDRDTQGYDDVYEKNYSTVYAGKDLIERFKGTTPSDLLKGMSNVYSGDARNSGALDPNIRGIQGQGRVPVTIDGTEQSLTVWRGYNGANSRSYIDPNLISSLQVVKGASLNSGIKTGTGGGVAAKTLEADDIVKPGKQYGAEIKLEGANNTVKERIPASYAGRDYRDVMDESAKVGWTNVYEDPLTSIQPKTRSDKSLLDLDDQALRIAVAAKQDTFDLLAAYAYRSRGNYFAGKKGSGYFLDHGIHEGNNVMVPNMAKYFKPNGEVTNSSNRMESYLLKGTWRPTDDQALQLTYRDSNTVYGEIMPSRIWWHTLDGLPQWPLSEVDTKAYSLEYKYNPENSRWLNLKFNLWQTDTESKTYSSGGFVNTVLGGFDSGYTYCHPNESILTPSQIANYARLCNFYKNMYGTDRNPNKSFIIQDTAFTSAKNTRKGVSLSNKFGLLDNLNLTIGADLTKEKLATEDEYVNDQTSSGVNFRMLPRAGRRSENQYHFNFDWQPASWLSFTAGAKSVSYWSFDDFLNNNKDNQNIKGIDSYQKEVAKKIVYTVHTDIYTQEMYDDEVRNGLIDPSREFTKQKIGKANSYTRVEYWHADEHGKYAAANNPFLNDSNMNVAELDMKIREPQNGLYYSDYRPGIREEAVIENAENTSVEKNKDHKKWAPSLSAAVQLNKNNRVYVNYNEAYRLPSLFETTLGFSASQSGYDLKPEHAHNWEVAYVYNMADLFKINQGLADIKIAYFNNKTDDVIERNNRLKFSNVDQQKIAGWELAGRYDNGRIFGDLSLVWNKQNKVCDESSGLMHNSAAMLYRGAAVQCVDYGFQAGYLVNMALPEYQANLTLGTRLFDNKLELGSRVAYFEGFKNPYLNVQDVSWFNQPLQWKDTWTVDAYAHYQHSSSLGFDLIGTNLSNQYYLDPISRSSTPAPGRTVKMGITYKF
ncbi:TonB-dependent receptor domain-containing protein [Acinetobacter sp.]|uniref:TonB-dependent receptor n=1 Tax=Acinetobacter sp. TaxID=472 RepID=UPI0035B15CE2